MPEQVEHPGTILFLYFPIVLLFQPVDPPPAVQSPDLVLLDPGRRAVLDDDAKGLPTVDPVGPHDRVAAGADRDGQSVVSGDFITDEQALNLRDRIADAEMSDARTKDLLASLAADSIEHIKSGQLVLAQTLVIAEKRRKAGAR